MESQKPKSVTIDSVVIIDASESDSRGNRAKPEATEKTIIPDEILSEKELPPHLREDSELHSPPKGHSQQYQPYTAQEIINMHHRMSRMYIVSRRGSIRAKVCLGLGFIGLFLFQVPVISTSAIILGFWELKAIRKRFSPISGRRLAQIGLVLGFIGIGLMLTKIVFWLKLRSF